MRLYEQYRPKSFAEVIVQDAVIAKIDALRDRGLSSRSGVLVGANRTNGHNRNHDWSSHSCP